MLNNLACRAYLGARRSFSSRIRPHLVSGRLSHTLHRSPRQMYVHWVDPKKRPGTLRVVGREGRGVDRSRPAFHTNHPLSFHSSNFTLIPTPNRRKVIEIPILEEDSYDKCVIMYCSIGEPRHIAGELMNVTISPAICATCQLYRLSLLLRPTGRRR